MCVRLRFVGLASLNKLYWRCSASISLPSSFTGEIASAAKSSRKVANCFQIFAASTVGSASLVLDVESFMGLPWVVMPAAVDILPDDNQFVLKTAAF